MADLFAQLGMNEEVVDSIKAQKAGGSLIDSGLYKAKVKELYVYKTDSEANMLQMVFDLENGDELRYSTCVKSGSSNADEKKHFKTTYTRNGKEFPLPGVIETKHLQQALGLSSLESVAGKVKRGDDDIDALTIPSAVGKELMLGVRQEEGDGEYGPKNIIQFYLNTNGENAEGENLIEKAKEFLAKNPVKGQKKSKSSNNSGSETKQEVPSGWGS